MAFRPNYGRDRVERQRAARARTEEKQRKKDEKVALRKAERVAAEAPPDDKIWRHCQEPSSLRRECRKARFGRPTSCSVQLECSSNYGDCTTKLAELVNRPTRTGSGTSITEQSSPLTLGDSVTRSNGRSFRPTQGCRQTQAVREVRRRVIGPFR